jgi:hypothetical protein
MESDSQPPPGVITDTGGIPNGWLMMSDVREHCHNRPGVKAL